jgi:hypothetical protein
MNAPDYSRGYLRVPRVVWKDLYCRAPLTRRQLQLVSVVIRESWGWQTRGGQVYLWTRPLTVRQFAQATGLSTDHLSRDLRDLVARGVLIEKGGCYQFVPDPQRWRPPAVQATEERWTAQKPPHGSAERALFPSGVKTAKKRERNGARPLKRELSPVGDKSLGRVRASGSREAATAEAALLEERFLQVVEAYAGPLDEDRRKGLRRWLKDAGIAAVWQALQPAFRRGPTACRTALERLLRAREVSADPADSRLSEEGRRG